MEALVAHMTPQELRAFLDGPALAPPPGVRPNFADPVDLQTNFLILCIVGSVVTGAAVGMRFYTRWHLTGKLIFEDLILFAGWILFVAGFNGVIYKSLRVHVGAHQWDLPVKNFVTYLKYFHEGSLLFFITMLLLRISIILQILRHFVPAGARNLTFWAAHTLIAANTAFWLALTLLEAFSCSPMKKLWEFYAEGQCLDRHAYLVASGAVNLGSEVLVMVLPQRIIWKLSLSTKQKLELTPLFLLGTLTCICSAIRLWQTMAQWPTTDMSYYLADSVILWCVPEIACCILVPCIPSLPQFIRIMQRKTSSSASQQRRRPATTLFNLPLAARNAARSWSGREPKTLRTIVSDIEYHELVMRTETTVDIAEREDTGPWVQPPATVHITGGKGPTKVFRPPTYFRNDIAGGRHDPEPPPEK